MAACACDCTSKIFDTAQALFDLVLSEADACGHKLPKCQEVLAGDIVHDCEKVAVAMSNITLGLPNAVTSQTPANNAYYASGCDPSWTLNLTVEIVRCGPKIQANGIVAPADQIASALTRSSDAQVLLRASRAFAQQSFGAVPVSVLFAPRQDFVSTVAIVQVAVGVEMCSHPAVEAS